jgi:hypothetical protein
MGREGSCIVRPTSISPEMFTRGSGVRSGPTKLRTAAEDLREIFLDRLKDLEIYSDKGKNVTMAGPSDKARFYLEHGTSELQELERKKIFTSVSIYIFHQLPAF